MVVVAGAIGAGVVVFAGVLALERAGRALLAWAEEGPEESELPVLRRARAAKRGFEVMPVPVRELTEVRPGNYQVVGVSRVDGEDRVLVFHAASAANAQLKAEMAGVVVTRVDFVNEGERVGDDDGSGTLGKSE